MKYLGIDYGTKYVGLAVSDDGGSMAFPRAVVPQSEAAGLITDLVAAEGIEALVVGFSIDQTGQENTLVPKARSFVSRLGLEVATFWQDERFTSLEASRHLFDNRPIANPRRSGKKHGRNDDSAAALILQRFLDKQNT